MSLLLSLLLPEPLQSRSRARVRTYTLKVVVVSVYAQHSFCSEAPTGPQEVTLKSAILEWSVFLAVVLIILILCSIFAQCTKSTVSLIVELAQSLVSNENQIQVTQEN